MKTIQFPQPPSNGFKVGLEYTDINNVILAIAATTIKQEAKIDAILSTVLTLASKLSERDYDDLSSQVNSIISDRVKENNKMFNDIIAAIEAKNK